MSPSLAPLSLVWVALAGLESMLELRVSMSGEATLPWQAMAGKSMITKAVVESWSHRVTTVRDGRNWYTAVTPSCGEGGRWHGITQRSSLRHGSDADQCRSANQGGP